MVLLHPPIPKFRAEGSEKELVDKDGGQIVITNGRIVGFNGDFGLQVNQSFHTKGYLITRNAPGQQRLLRSRPAIRSSSSPVVQ